MDSLRQERGLSSGEKCPESPYAGHPSNQHRVPGSYEGAPEAQHRVAGGGQHDGAPGKLHRVPGGGQQAVFGGFTPHQGVTPEAYNASCNPESCQERLLLAPRQRKVIYLILCIFQTGLIPSNQIQDPRETSVIYFGSESG